MYHDEFVYMLYVQFLFMDFTICEEACYSYSLLSDLLFFYCWNYMSVSMFGGTLPIAFYACLIWTIFMQQCHFQ